MILSEKDGELYYELWLTLLDYVNKKYNVIKDLNNIHKLKFINPDKLKLIALKLYENVSIIDEYVKLNDQLEEEKKDILLSWKNCRTGKFMVERHLKKGSILISMENQNVYIVNGIISSIEEMLYGAKLPLMIETTLLPFKDKIITDGLVMPYSISIGAGMTKSFKEVYISAKKSGEIIDRGNLLKYHYKDNISEALEEQIKNDKRIDAVDEGTVEEWQLPNIVTRDDVIKLAFKYKKTFLWKKIYDNQPFAVKLHTGEIGFICIMGNGDIDYSIALYIGNDGYESYRRLLTAEMYYYSEEESMEILMEQKCLQLGLEEKEMLSNEEFDEVKRIAMDNGIKLSGKHPYPKLLKYEPFHHPWKMDKCEDLKYMYEAILAAIYMADLLGNKDPEDLYIFEINEFCQQLPLFKLSNSGLVYIGTHKIPEYKEDEFDIIIFQNDIAINTVKKMKKEGIWECEYVRMPEPVQDSDDEAPYYPLVPLLVNSETRYVMPFHLSFSDEDNPHERVNYLYSMITNYKKAPKEIRCNDMRTFCIVRDFCEKTGIKISFDEEELDALWDVKEHIFNDYGEYDEEDIMDEYNEVIEMLEDILLMNRSEVRSISKNLKMYIMEMLDAGFVPDDLAEQVRKKLKL